MTPAITLHQRSTAFMDWIPQSYWWLSFALVCYVKLCPDLEFPASYTHGIPYTLDQYSLLYCDVSRENTSLSVTASVAFFYLARN